jgi:hypothetical protein
MPASTCGSLVTSIATDRILAAELGGRRVGAGLIEISDHDLGAFAQITARNLLTDAARSPGDDRDFG